MDFDKILSEIGDFGRYQQINYLLLCLPVMVAAANSLSYVFTAMNPDYRCLVPECEHPHNTSYKQDWTMNAIPGTMKSLQDFKPTFCKRYKPSIVQELDTTYSSNCSAAWFTDELIDCETWIFDTEFRSVVHEWNIKCDRNQWKLALIGTMHFAGIVIASGASGFFADKYGRKSVLICSIVVMATSGILQGVSSNYEMFLVFAFLNAGGSAGVYPSAFILGVEMVGAKKRGIAGVGLNFFHAIGEAMVGLIAWITRDWYQLQMIISIPPLFLGFYYWYIPESIRWLLANENYTKANDIIRKAAFINGKIPKGKHLTIEININRPDVIGPNSQSVKGGRMTAGFNALFRSRIMIFRCCILLFIWATSAFVYFGLSLMSATLNGNKFLTFSLVCLAEIPGYTFAWISMVKIGRRWTMVCSLIMSGSMCTVCAYCLDGNAWVLVTIYSIAKIGITASFAIIFVITAEMLPTVIRSAGVGAMATVSRMAAMMAPFVPLLGDLYKPAPLLAFGATAIIGGFLATFLPKKLGEKLPDTVEQAEQIGNNAEL